MLKILPVTAGSSSSDKSVCRTAQPEGRASCSFLKHMIPQRYLELCLLRGLMFYRGCPSATFSFIFLLSLSPFIYSLLPRLLLTSVFVMEDKGMGDSGGVGVGGGGSRSEGGEEKGEMEKEWRLVMPEH